MKSTTWKLDSPPCIPGRLPGIPDGFTQQMEQLTRHLEAEKVNHRGNVIIRKSLPHLKKSWVKLNLSTAVIAASRAMDPVCIASCSKCWALPSPCFWFQHFLYLVADGSNIPGDAGPQHLELAQAEQAVPSDPKVLGSIPGARFHFSLANTA